MEELPQVLERGETDGLLLDSFIAGHYQDLFVKFLLADVIEYVFSYGMILRNKGLRMNSCFRIYLDMYKDKLFLDVSKAVKPFKVSTVLCSSQLFFIFYVQGMVI